ncbi:MAG: hypothetical protein HC836_25775 [Richelia sp. RM2_1_2]|nr:hypothetical protein [Richelia sp. RM2_1_2]
MNSVIDSRYTYKVKSVEKVVDGDTVDLIIDLGFNITVKERIRLSGINTPELRSGTIESKNLAQAAAVKLADLLQRGDVYIKTERDKTEKYGRYLGYLIVYVTEFGSELNVNKILLDEGFAVKF